MKNLSRLVSFALLAMLPLVLVQCKDAGQTSVEKPITYPFFPKAKMVDDLEANEKLASQVQKFLRASFLSALRDRRWSELGITLNEQFVSNWPQLKLNEFGGSKAYTYLRTKNLGKMSDKPAFVTNLRTAFSSWVAIEKTEWRSFDSRASNTNPQLVAQKIHVGLFGQLASEKRVQIKATLQVLVEIKSSGLELRRLMVEELLMSQSELPLFEDISADVGFDHFLTSTDKDNLQSMIDEREMTATGGLTALDFNKDGYWDILASHQAKGSTLFINDSQGGFTKKAIDILSKEQQAAKFYLWLDLDNDGQEELFSTRPHLFRVKDGELIAQPKALAYRPDPTIRAPNYEGLTACDINQDGLLDVIATGYSHADSPKGFNNVDSQAGLRNLVFINQGKLRFTEESKARGITQTRYSFVAECFDFDNDGDLDLYFGNDYGPNEYYENDGTGNFTLKPDHPLASGTSFSMGISIADYDNTGEKWMSISNMYSHSGSRIVPFSKGLSPKSMQTLAKLAAGNTLYRISDQSFEEAAQSLGVDMADWAWGNVFFDFDNDGDKDLYVVNGYTSHRDAKAPDY